MCCATQIHGSKCNSVAPNFHGIVAVFDALPPVVTTQSAAAAGIGTASAVGAGTSNHMAQSGAQGPAHQVLMCVGNGARIVEHRHVGNMVTESSDVNEHESFVTIPPSAVCVYSSFSTVGHCLTNQMVHSGTQSHLWVCSGARSVTQTHHVHPEARRRTLDEFEPFATSRYHPALSRPIPHFLLWSGALWGVAYCTRSYG
jgi:hypothetical protein